MGPCHAGKVSDNGASIRANYPTTSLSTNTIGTHAVFDGNMLATKVRFRPTVLIVDARCEGNVIR